MNKLKFLLAVLAFVIFSCSDDDEAVDTRDQAIGTYNYSTNLFLLNGTTLTPIPYTETGTMTVEKTSTGIRAQSGGETIFDGTKVTAASNGFAFDIATQNVDFDGDVVSVEGYQNATLTNNSGGTVKYHGVYLSANKRMEANFKFTVQTNSGLATAVVQIVGTKVN